MLMVTGTACLMAASSVSFSSRIFLIGIGGERKGMWVTVCIETAAKFGILIESGIKTVFIIHN